MADTTETTKEEEKVTEENKIIGTPYADQYGAFVDGEKFHSELVNIQLDFGLTPSIGAPDQATIKAINDYIVDILTNHAEETLDPDPTGKHNRITINTNVSTDPKKVEIEPRTYEFEPATRGNESTFNVYELDDKGKRVKGDPTPLEVLYDKENQKNAHPAFMEVASKYNEHLRQKIAENTPSDSDLAMLDEFQSLREEVLRSQKGAIGIPEDLAEEFAQSVSTPGFTQEQFKKSELYQKIKEKAEKPEQIDDFVYTMLLITQDMQTFGSNFPQLRDEQQKADGIYKWMHKAVGQGASMAAAHNFELSQGKIDDNIFAHNVYDILNRMPEISSTRLSLLTNEKYPKQYNELVAYFGTDGNRLITKDEIEDYARDRFEIYAIQKLSKGEKTLPGDADKETIKAFIKENENLLSNVNDAIHGDYIPEGDTKPLLFNPYEKDLQFVYKGFEKTNLDDPFFRQEVDKIYNKMHFAPDLNYVLQTCNPKQISDLYEAGRESLSKDPEAFTAALRKHAQRFGVPKKNINDVAQKIFEKVNNDDIASLARFKESEQHIIIEALASKLRPELYENESYNRLITNYYKNHSTGITKAAAGQAELDEYGAVKLDENGQSSWNGGFNGRYGGPDNDQMLRSFVRGMGRDFAKHFGTNGATIEDVLYNADGTKNYKIGLDEAVDKIRSEAGDAAADGFKNAVLSNSQANVYQYFMVMRLSEYRNNRQKFATGILEQQMLDRKLNQAQNAEAAKEKQDANSADGSENDNDEELSPEEIEQLLKENGYDFSLDPENPDDGIDNEWAKGGGVVPARYAAMGITNIMPDLKAKTIQKYGVNTPSITPDERPLRTADALAKRALDPASSQTEKELAGRLLRKHMAKHGIPMEKIATFGHNADNLNKLFPDVAPKP
ncbi:MAG: hypothetical protein KTR28_06825, partial [Micavibrio sp.]|nr:hypothetical protein [Micavibrio sp.]